MVSQTRLVDLLIELVKVDSETKHEQEISALLKRKFTELGVHVEEDDSAARSGHGSGNLIVTMEATDGYEQAPAVLFTAHMDTVVPGKGIKPRVDDDGYIRSEIGRASCRERV